MIKIDDTSSRKKKNERFQNNKSRSREMMFTGNIRTLGAGS